MRTQETSSTPLSPVSSASDPFVHGAGGGDGVTSRNNSNASGYISDDEISIDIPEDTLFPVSSQHRRTLELLVRVHSDDSSSSSSSSSENLIFPHNFLRKSTVCSLEDCQTRMVLDPKFSTRNDYGSIHPTDPTISAQLNVSPRPRNPHLLNARLSSIEIESEDDDIIHHVHTAASSKMTQGDLYQRQPLLPTPTKQNEKWGNHTTITHTKEYYDDDDDDTEDLPRNGLMNSSSNGITKILMPPPVREEPKFPKEKWKTFIALFVMIINFILTTASLAMVHERVPDRDKYGPLPDKFLDTVPAFDWALDVSEYLIMISVNATALVLVFHKHRFIVFRRVFLILSLLYLMRAITMYITVLPVASKTYYCSPKANQTSAYIVATRVLQIISGFGLSVNGKHTYCGDYIYSGHTVILVLSYQLISEYSPKRFLPLHYMSLLVSLTGVIMVLLAHGHYSVDVVIAYYVTTRLFWTYHTLANNSALKKRSPNNYFGREWWYRAFQYFEGNVGAPVPHQYNWPLPWPRWCHSKSRDS